MESLHCTPPHGMAKWSAFGVWWRSVVPTSQVATNWGNIFVLHLHLHFSAVLHHRCDTCPLTNVAVVCDRRGRRASPSVLHGDSWHLFCCFVDCLWCRAVQLLAQRLRRVLWRVYRGFVPVRCLFFSLD